MKTKTVTVHEGEKLGPVDWSYDFAAHGWGPHKGGHNPECIPKEVEMLRQLETWYLAGKPCEVLMYGMWEPVVDVGMYDGWPFWKPTPSFMSRTWLGASWHPFFSIYAVREIES